MIRGMKGIMKMKTIVIIAIAAFAALDANAEQYRLKVATSVDIVEDGEVVGTKRLKAGTVFELAGATTSTKSTEAAEPAVGGADKKNAIKSGTSEMPYKLFLIKRPKSGAWFRCKVEIDTYYNYDFDGKKSIYQSVSIRAYKPDGEDYDNTSGYIKKSNRAYKRLMELLKDGNGHLIFAKLIPVVNQDDDSSIIEDFKPISE